MAQSLLDVFKVKPEFIIEEPDGSYTNANVICTSSQPSLSLSHPQPVRFKLFINKNFDNKFSEFSNLVFDKVQSQPLISFYKDTHSISSIILSYIDDGDSYIIGDDEQLRDFLSNHTELGALTRLNLTKKKLKDDSSTSISSISSSSSGSMGSGGGVGSSSSSSSSSSCSCSSSSSSSSSNSNSNSNSSSNENKRKYGWSTPPSNNASKNLRTPTDQTPSSNTASLNLRNDLRPQFDLAGGSFISLPTFIFRKIKIFSSDSIPRDLQRTEKVKLLDIPVALHELQIKEFNFIRKFDKQFCNLLENAVFFTPLIFNGLLPSTIALFEDLSFKYNKLSNDLLDQSQSSQHLEYGNSLHFRGLLAKHFKCKMIIFTNNTELSTPDFVNKVNHTFSKYGLPELPWGYTLAKVTDENQLDTDSDAMIIDRNGGAALCGVIDNNGAALCGVIDNNGAAQGGVIDNNGAAQGGGITQRNSKVTDENQLDSDSDAMIIDNNNGGAAQGGGITQRIQSPTGGEIDTCKYPRVPFNDDGLNSINKGAASLVQDFNLLRYIAITATLKSKLYNDSIVLSEEDKDFLLSQSFNSCDISDRSKIVELLASILNRRPSNLIIDVINKGRNVKQSTEHTVESYNSRLFCVTYGLMSLAPTHFENNSIRNSDNQISCKALCAYCKDTISIAGSTTSCQEHSKRCIRKLVSNLQQNIRNRKTLLNDSKYKNKEDLFKLQIREYEQLHEELSYFENEFNTAPNNSSNSNTPNNTIADCFRLQHAATQAKINFDKKLDLLLFAAMMGKPATLASEPPNSL